MGQRGAAVAAWRATHRGGVIEPPIPPSTWTSVDMRGQLPTRPGAAPYPHRDINRVARFRVHYTAGSTWSTVQDIAAYQTGPGAQEPFPAIAYHLLVEGDGRVNWCHNLDIRVWGSAAPGSNERDIHCCYTGDYEPTAAQLNGLKHALAWAEEQRGMMLELLAHRSDYATQCPGPTWEQWSSQLR